MAFKSRWSAGGLLVVSVVFGAACHKPGPSAVTVVHPQRKDAAVTVAFDGVVRPVYTVHMRCSLKRARIVRCMVTEGQVIRPGQQLIAFDDTASRAELARLQAEAKVARKHLDLLRNTAAERMQKEFERSQKTVAICWETKAKALQALDRARREGTPDDVRAAQGTVQRATATLAWCQRARFQILNRTPVGRLPDVSLANDRLMAAETAVRRAAYSLPDPFLRARESGLVLRCRARVGQTVVRNQPLMDVVPLLHLGVGFRLPAGWRKGTIAGGKTYFQAFYPLYARNRYGGMAAAIPGAEAIVTFPAFPNREFHGTLDEGVRREGSQDIQMVVLSGVPQQLRPGMPARVSVIVDRCVRALTVPRSAIVDEQAHPAVFVIRDGRVTRQPVKISVGSSPEAIVKEGLGDGEIVVRDPRRVTEGLRVRPVWAG